MIYLLFTSLKVISLIAISLALFTALLVVSGCQIGGESSEGGEVKLLVTINFGEEYIFDETVEATPGDNINSLLERHMEVEYAYGGQFVNSIEGRSSGYTGEGSGADKKDWFLYVNGILSEAAAGTHYPEEGDVIWWNYQSWDEMFFVPAVVGGFPQPFINGYRQSEPGTLIMHGGSGAGEHAEKMAAYLKSEGLNDLEIEAYDEKMAEERSEMTMVIAEWDELSASPFWQGIQENRSQTGWFVEFDDDRIFPLDREGNKAEDPDEVDGAVLATGSGMGDENTLWLITAWEEDSLRQIVDIMTTTPGTLAGKSGAVLKNNELLKLPR